MIGPRASVLECAGAPALLLGGAGSWIAKRKVVTLRPSVSWIKGELLQKVTKQTMMFESRREERAECTPRCRVDSHAGEKAVEHHRAPRHFATAKIVRRVRV